MEIFEINSNQLNLDDIEHIITNNVQIKLSDESAKAVQ